MTTVTVQLCFGDLISIFFFCKMDLNITHLLHIMALLNKSEGKCRNDAITGSPTISLK